MKPFSLWAPLAKEVTLVVDDGEHAMKRQPRGLWRNDDVPVREGQRYRYRVDGRGPYPDPRSPWQPDGVHGPSCRVDHGTFDWHDDGFVPTALARAVLYELHIGTFSEEGTYRGAMAKLEHLVELGVTHLEVMPIAAFAGQRGWGYDGVALYSPHPAYGTPDELKALVQHAHRLGLAVLLDAVYNHLGPAGAYAPAFAPYFTDRVKTPWGDAINLDGPHSDGVREFILDNACMWLRDYHFDGLRLDAVHGMHDHSATHLLEALALRVHHLSGQTGRDLVLIAESDLGAPILVQPRELGGYGLDAHWQDDFHHAVHAYLTGEDTGVLMDFGSLADIATALRQGYVYEGQYSRYRQRSHGRPPRHVRPEQLIVFTQNHDQTGNRARGERLTHLLTDQISKASAALLLLGPFVPLLFQGEEWGASTPFLYFTDHDDELGKLVTEGRRRDFEAFGWASGDLPDPQAESSFTRSKLRWDERDQPAHRALLQWHRSLIELRGSLPDGAPVEVAFEETSRWLTLRRGPLIALFNFAHQEQTLVLPDGTWHVVLHSQHAQEAAQHEQMVLAAHATAIVRRG